MDKFVRYENALSKFSQPGSRFAILPELTASGKAAGFSAEDIIADARRFGVMDKDADIRRMFDGSTAKRQVDGCSIRRPFVRRSLPAPTVAYSNEVRSRIACGIEYDSFDALARLSPVNVAGLGDRDAARSQLNAMFMPGDLILAGTMKLGVGERNLRSAREWIADDGLPGWEQVKVNPFTGEAAPGGKRGTTRIGEKCLARFSLMMMEFDALPLADQCRFWAGMILRRMPVVAVVYSGGKSLHGLIRVGAANERVWWDRCAQAKALYCSDPDGKYRADEQAMRPAVAVRLAGAVRHDTGRRQELLYVDPPQTRAEPLGAPYSASGRAGDAVDAPGQEARPSGILTRPVADARNVRYRCTECNHVDKCKAGFGRFWPEKSRNGVGCTYCAWAL